MKAKMERYGGIHICKKCGTARSNDRSKSCEGCKKLAEGKRKMKKLYKKKPVAVEAIQWTGENLKEIIDFAGMHKSAKHLLWEEYEILVHKEGLKIFTLEGPHMASTGDYIIKGIKGEVYPCKPDIFEETYEEYPLNKK